MPTADCYKERPPVVAVLAGPAASLLLGLAAFWGALNAGPVSRPLEAFLGYLSIVNLIFALMHCVPAAPFDAGTLLGMLLVRLGVPPDGAARALAALGVLVGCGCLVYGLWQLLVPRSGLFGIWVCVVGGLVLYSLLVRGWQRAPTGPTAPR